MGEEEHVTAEEFAYSLMLTMSITFQMTIFYLVNWPDKDIRAYAWSIIGNTILIFSGVLTFSACDDLLTYYVIEPHPDYEAYVSCAHFVFWGSLMHMVIARCSGWSPKKLVVEQESEREEEADSKETEQRKRNNECFATLLGHISGFAAIDFFGFLQQNTFLRKTPVSAGSVSLITVFGLLLFFSFKGYLRRHLYRPSEEVEEMWCEVAVDKENDIAGLASSALAFLAFRFSFIGHLPSPEGPVVATPAVALHEMGQILYLGLFWLAAGIFMLWFHYASGLIDHEEEEAWPTRISNIVQNFCNMCVAWASLFQLKLFLRWAQWFGAEGESIIARITIAFLISYAAFVFIWLLDKIDDWMKERNIQANWMNNIITALGLAIGFAWEQSFDTAMDDLGLRLMHRFGIPSSLTVWIKLVFSMLLCATVLPAFRWYILPEVEEAQEEKKEKDDKIKERFKGKQRLNIINESMSFLNEELGQVGDLVVKETTGGAERLTGFVDSQVRQPLLATQQTQPALRSMHNDVPLARRSPRLHADVPLARPVSMPSLPDRQSLQ